MKKIFLLSALWGLVMAATITTIYAQVANTSIVDRMKAAVHAFTLSSDLNPGQTGYESAPVSGKKTGNMLTAAEWNRMLELISEGSVGGGGSGWTDVSLMTDSADFDTTCLYEVQLKTTDVINNNLINGDTSWRTGIIKGNKYLGLAFTDGSATTYSVWGIQSSNKNVYGYRDANGTFVPVNSVSVLGMKKLCGGIGGGGTGTGNRPIVCSKTANSGKPTGYIGAIDVTFSATDCTGGVLPDTTKYSGAIQRMQVCGGVETFSIQDTTVRIFSNNLCKWPSGKDYYFTVLYVPL